LSLQDLLDSRLIMVTGKGGTGKTTYAAALATLAAAKGRRTCLCELDNQRPSMPAIFGVDAGFDPIEVRPNLFTCNIRWSEALRAYLASMIPVRRIVRLILDNQIVGRFVDFTPGSQELVSLSIVGNLVDEYDLVVVDMPASGHAFSLLDVTRSALGLFRSGPVRRRAGELVELIRAETSRMVYVALPEEMVVNETIETYEKMNAYNMIGGKPMIFLNRATLPSMTDDERELIRRLSALDLPGLRGEFVRAGRWEDQLEQATLSSQKRLRESLPGEPILVPPAGAGGVPRLVAESVSVHLGRHVGLSRRSLAST